MSYIIKHHKKKSYYRKWTEIGPMFTDKKKEAYKFETKGEASSVMYRHFRFIGYDIKEE